jgi:DnaJ-class molecular chaperone
VTEFKKTEKARNLLGLDEEASLEEIKKAFRALSLKYHPDTCKEQDKKHCEKQFKLIVQAKETLLNYCANYRFSFKEQAVKKNAMDRKQYEHLKRFYEDWFGDLNL